MPDQTVQTVPLLSKRRERALLVQKLQHGVPTVVLLFHGLTRLGEPHDWSRVVGVAEIIASALVIGAFSHRLRAVRRNTHAGAPSAHHGVDWIDLCLGLMLSVEAWSHWYETGRVQRPTLLLALTMVGLGLLHGRMTTAGRRRRVVRIGSDGVSIGERFFRRFAATWAELTSIDLGPRHARIVRKDGRTCTIDFADLQNADDVRAVLARAQDLLAQTAPPATTGSLPT